MIKERQEYNERILEAVKECLEKNPELRFIQALWALGIVDREDRFYEEPVETWERIQGLHKEIPKNPTDCIDTILEMCDKAIGIYDNEEFFEDDCDEFLGQSLMAQEIKEIIEIFKNSQRENLAKK